MHFFVTATDTGAGKTFVTQRLIQTLRASGIDAIGMKPICCGGREDAEILRDAAAGVCDINLVNPLWLRAPLSPFAASMVESRPLDLSLVREAFATLSTTYECVIVEGIGGWMVPIMQNYDVPDLVRDLGLPVMVVAQNRLGAINHTRLTLQAIEHSRVKCLGYILNQAGPEEDPALLTNAAVLQELTPVPLLAEISWKQTNPLESFPSLYKTWTRVS